jgi:hypothetical protein
MTRAQIVSRLLELPNELAKAETKAILAAQAVAKAKDRLADEEARLIATVLPCGEPLLTGKNAKQRAAQVRQQTAVHRAGVRADEVALDVERALLHRLEVEFSALKAVARLLSGEEERLAA